jgi:uncharacterized protein YbaR (Trm112 family)
MAARHGLAAILRDALKGALLRMRSGYIRQALSRRRRWIYVRAVIRKSEAPMTTERPAGSVDPKLLEILVCPLTKGPLEYDSDKQELVSRAAKLAYPIRDGIPIMLPEEARPLD